MGRSLDKVSRKKSYDIKDSRVKRGLGRRGLSRRRKQRGGGATPAVQKALDDIKALLADTTGKSADTIGAESASIPSAVTTAAINAAGATAPISADDQAVIVVINQINDNIQKVVDFLKTTPAPAQIATGTDQVVIAYAELYKIENKVKDTSLYTDLHKIYTNLKEDGTVTPAPASATAASVAVAAATAVTPASLLGLTHIAVFVPIEEKGGAYNVKSTDPSPYAYYVSDTGTATTGSSNSTPGLVSIDATGANKATTCNDVTTTWSKHP